MTKALLILISLMLIKSETQAQLFEEKVTVFNVTYKASEVTGQKNFDAIDFLYRTKILTPLQKRKRDELLYSLGSYRRDKNIFEVLNLFNLSFERNSYPFLDLIDFDYYRNVSFEQLESEYAGIENDEEYKRVKDYIVDSTHLSILQRKNILFRASKDLRNKIIMTRYEKISNPFDVEKTKASKMVTELKAQLDTIKINASTEISAKVHAYLSRLADEATTIKGYYIDIKLHPSYVSKIDYYINKSLKVSLGDDQFATNLKKYIESNTAALNTGLVALQMEGKFNKTKVSLDSIAVDLASKFQLPADEIRKISASVNFAFTRNEKKIFAVQFDNAFVIRYFTSKILDDLNFQKLEFTREDAVTHGKNMGILIKAIEKYYETNGEFPEDLNVLNKDDAIAILGESKLNYKVTSATTARFAFAGKDYELNTTDDKVYIGTDGKFVLLKAKE